MKTSKSKPFPVDSQKSQQTFTPPNKASRNAGGTGRQAYTIRVSRRDRHHHRPGK